MSVEPVAPHKPGKEFPADCGIETQLDLMKSGRPNRICEILPAPPSTGSSSPGPAALSPGLNASASVCMPTNK